MCMNLFKFHNNNASENYTVFTICVTQDAFRGFCLSSAVCNVKNPPNSSIFIDSLEAFTAIFRSTLIGRFQSVFDCSNLLAEGENFCRNQEAWAG